MLSPRGWKGWGFVRRTPPLATSPQPPARTCSTSARTAGSSSAANSVRAGRRITLAQSYPGCKDYKKSNSDFPQPGDDQKYRGTRERRSPAESEGSCPCPPASSTHQPRTSAPGLASPARGEPPCWLRVPKHSERGQLFRSPQALAAGAQGAPGQRRGAHSAAGGAGPPTFPRRHTGPAS